MKIKKSEYRCFFSEKDSVLAMERLTALINMGRKYLSETYGARKSFYKITSFSYGEGGCDVNFVDEGEESSFRYQFEYICKTNTVTFALFTLQGLEGEVEIGQLKRA